ncbi:hypothetical protein ONZ45_g10999 [Pleurotus djamor]|nr:hypothetical protein ONZ45_g10999 [Pleurotus djamor]
MIPLPLRLLGLLYVVLLVTPTSSSESSKSLGIRSTFTSTTQLPASSQTVVETNASLPVPSQIDVASGSTSLGKTSASIATTVSSSSRIAASPSQPQSSDGVHPTSNGPASFQSSIPGLFPGTNPNKPPPVGESGTVIPNFDTAWKVAYSKAKSKVEKLGLDELVSITTGLASTGRSGRCVGNIPAIEGDGGWPGLCLQDSPLGVRLADFVTAFPSGINTAATFNRNFMRTRGLFMGLEHVGKGVNVALGPMMNLGRVAEGGRNFEGFGADPFLAAEGKLYIASYETILGMQQGGVQACAKHFIDNEQETARTTSSSNVDDRTQHEVYALPFIRSVMAGVASVMCSYNKINGTYACENDETLNGLLKQELGFRGYVMSDWGGTHSTLSAVAGLDMTMPGNVDRGIGSYFGGNLTTYVQNGTIPRTRLEDMATRILAGWYLLNQDSPEFPAVNFNGNNPADEMTNEHVDVQDDHHTVVRDIGAASIVLLKNINNTLPLQKPRSILLAGSDAGPGRIGPNEFRDQNGDDGILAMGWGSGTANFTYLISPLEAIQARARADRTSISWILDDFNLARAGNMAIGRSVAMVFVNADSGEGSDRANLTTWHGGEALIAAVAAQNKNTVVVVHSVGPVLVESWIDHPNVTAVLWAGVSGTETGNALTDVLYGRSEEIDLNVPYTDGLFIDYRGFDARNLTPRFEFGFGLSYTSFAYSNLKISKVTLDNDVGASNWDAGHPSPTGFGSSTALCFDLHNVGPVSGTEIPQLYIAFPESAREPPSILRGFDSVHLGPGQRRTVTITLSRHSLSIWDTVAQGWRKPDGNMGVMLRSVQQHSTLLNNNFYNATTQNMSEYLPNLGRPAGMIGPVGLWKPFDKEGMLDINLFVVRSRTLRTYHPTSRDQHWSITWTLGKSETGHIAQRRIHIVREGQHPHLTNWGPITMAVGKATLEEGVSILISRIDFEDRKTIEEIAKSTPVRKPDGDWNCQDWLETVLMEAVRRGLLPYDGVQAALRRAREVQPIPFRG